MPSTPFVPAINVAQVEFRYLIYGQQVENVMYFRRTDLAALTESDVEELLDALEAEWLITGAPLYTNEVALVELYATDLTTETAFTVSSVMSHLGTHSGAGTPSNVTLTTTFVTANRGRSGRGRNYQVQVPESEVSGNTILSTYRADVLLYYAGLVSAIVAIPTEWEHVVVSRRTDNAWRELAFVQRVQAYRHADAFSDSQRRRLTGRGA